MKMTLKIDIIHTALFQMQIKLQSVTATIYSKLQLTTVWLTTIVYNKPLIMIS